MTRTPGYRRATALVLILGASGGLAACGKHKDEPPPPIRPVLSLVVEPKVEEVFGPFTGTVQPRYQTALGFRASGRMVSRNANVGDRVAKGAVLATLDPRVARFALASAQADLANAQATLVNATATDQRQRSLLTTQSVSQAQVDAAVAAKDAALAKVNQAQAALTKAQEQSDYTALRSDYDGVITSWSLEVGQVVSSGQTVVTVARPEIRDAVFDVPDDLIGKVQPGAGFTVSLQADDTITVAGEVREIGPQADSATRTRRIRLTLKTPPEVFRLGTTVTITLVSQEPPVITLPATAIIEKDGHASVWLVAGRGPAALTAALKPVEVAARQDGAVTVTSGLAKGDRVITAGVHSLSDGQPIKLLGP